MSANANGTTALLASLGWGTVRGIAQPIDRAAKGIWNKMPEGMKRYARSAWENPTAVKVATIGSAALLGAAGATTLLGLGAIGAGAGAAAAAGTTTYTTWGKDPKPTLKVIAAAGAGVVGAQVAMLAAPVVGTVIAGMGALTTASTTAAATLMAEHPGQLIEADIPNLAPFELGTIGVNPDDPIHPAEALEALRRAPVTFKQNHPAGMSAKRAQTVVVDPRDENLTAQRKKTDLQKDRLVENVSAYVSAYFIFVNRLGLDALLTDDVLMKITQMAVQRGEDGEKLYSVWDACMLTLEEREIELSFFQKIQARFWYLLTDTIGIIPNMFNALADKILCQLRGGVEGEKPTIAVSKMLSIAGKFLNDYNGAVERYANAGTAGFPQLKRGGLSAYEKEVIDGLGEDGILARVETEKMPEEDLGKLMMKELCKEFVAVIVDDPNLFPSIPFFRGLQTITLFGLRIGIAFDVLEWFIGGIINWIARKLVKWYVPDFVQSLVQKGIDQTVRGNYSFKIAVATSLKEQVDELAKELDNDIPSTPLRFGDNDELSRAIRQLIKTLELKTCNEDQQKLRKKFEELTHPSDEIEERQKTLCTETIKGAQLLINYYTEQPEEIEKLFGKLFKLFTDPFQAEATVYTSVDYEAAKDSFKESVAKLVKAQVTEGVQARLRGTPEYIQTVLHGKRIDLSDVVERERTDAQGNRLYPNPDLQPLQLDKTGKNPLYKGLFLEQKEKAVATIQVMQGLVLEMCREVHSDANAHLLDEVVGFVEPNLPEAFTPLERKIAIEQAKLRHKIANLRAQIGAVAANDPARESKLAALNEQIRLIGEALKLVKPLEELNTLETPNDHLLKNLENYMKVIGEFVAHIDSLNLDQYHEMIRKKFYRAFDPIYQAFVPLTAQLTTLQRLGKSYDKAKRLEEQFAEIGEKIRQNPSNLLALLTGKSINVENIDKDFDGHDSKPAIYVAPFKQFVVELKRLSEEQEEQNRILSQMDELGRFDEEGRPLKGLSQSPEQNRTYGEILNALDRVSGAILEYPKDTIDKIRRLIPQEDQGTEENPGPLFIAIEELQTKAGLSPTPDLTADHKAVNTQLRKVARKYFMKKQDKIREKGVKLTALKTWANAERVTAMRERNAARAELLQKLGAAQNGLKADTDALAEKIKHVELPPMHFPVNDAVPRIPFINRYINNRYANPVIDNINQLTTKAYEFFTSQEISEAAARLALGEYVSTHKK